MPKEHDDAEFCPDCGEKRYTGHFVWCDALIGSKDYRPWQRPTRTKPLTVDSPELDDEIRNAHDAGHLDHELARRALYASNSVFAVGLRRSEARARAVEIINAHRAAEIINAHRAQQEGR